MYVESNFFSGKSLSLGVLMYRKSTEISIQKLKSKIHFNENYLGTIYTSRNEANYIGRHIHFKSSHNKWLKFFCPSTYFVFVKRNKLVFSFRKYNLLWKKKHFLMCIRSLCAMRYICCNQFCFFAFYAVSPSRIYITVSNQTNDKIKVHIKENRDEKKLEQHSYQ